MLACGSAGMLTATLASWLPALGACDIQMQAVNTHCGHLACMHEYHHHPQPGTTQQTQQVAEKSGRLSGRANKVVLNLHLVDLT